MLLSPETNVIKLDSQDKLLVIAPHPDDEVVGSAGLIQKVKNAGGKVYIHFLTIGDTKDFSKKGLSTGDERKKEIKKVANFLKYDDYDISFVGDEYQLKLDKLGRLAIINRIERESNVAIEKIKPTIVSFPSVSSYNQDHEIAAKATHAALRNSSSEKYFVPTVISYEEGADEWRLASESPPNFFVTLSDEEFEVKIEALKLYSSQWREFPSSRSEETLRALATLRGSFSNSRYAEAHHILRDLT